VEGFVRLSPAYLKGSEKVGCKERVKCKEELEARKESREKLEKLEDASETDTYYGPDTADSDQHVFNMRPTVWQI
jgi:hypothetical protein